MDDKYLGKAVFVSLYTVRVETVEISQALYDRQMFTFPERGRGWRSNQRCLAYEVASGRMINTWSIAKHPRLPQ